MPKQKLVKISLYAALICCMLVPASADLAPNATDFFYPELTYKEDQNGEVTHFFKGGTESRKGVGTASVFADFDNDFRVELVARDNDQEYLKAFFRRNNTFEAVTGTSDKPKSGSTLAVGELDDDANNKSDVLFRDQNGELAAIDGDGSEQFSISNFKNPVDVGDFDEDGFEEILYVDGNNNYLRKFNYVPSDPDQKTSLVAQISITPTKFGTMVSDADGDGRPEVVYPDGSQGIKGIDHTDSSPTIVSDQVDIYMGATGRAIAPLDFDGDNETEFVAPRSSDKQLTVVDDTTTTPLGVSTSGSDIDLFSYLPARVANLSANRSVFLGTQTAGIQFNVSDGDGYTDIVDGHTKVRFSSPDNDNYTVNAARIDSGFAQDGSKDFKAAFDIPDTGPEGTWTYTAFSRDEKGAGTSSTGEFQVSLNNGTINATLLEPLNDTIVKKGSNFVINSSIECIDGDCGRVNATPRYNSTPTSANKVIPNGSGTPFHTQRASEKSCGTLNEGEQCFLNWSVNATGVEDSHRLLDVNASSFSPAVEPDNTEDRLVRIDLAVVVSLRYDLVDFGSLDPELTNQSAQGNSGLLYNMTVFDNSIPVTSIEVNASDLASSQQYNIQEYNIPDENIFISPDSDPSNQTGHKTQLGGGFNTVLGVQTVSPGENFTHFFYIDTPGGIASGGYTGEIEFRANP